MQGYVLIRKGVYYVRLTYKDLSGTRKDKFISTKLQATVPRKDAEQIMLVFLQKYAYLDRGITQKKFADYLIYWKEQQKGKVAQSTYDGFDTYINRHLEPYFRNTGVYLQELTPKHIMDFETYLSQPGSRLDHQSGAQSSTSVRKMMSVLRNVLNYAVMSGEILSNPALGIPLPKKQHQRVERQVFMTAAEAQNMLTAISGEEIASVVYTTIYYGLRKSEVLGLKWSAVDFNKNTLSIEFTVVKNRTIVEKPTTKTDCSRRVYELLPEIKELLLQLKAEQIKKQNVFPNYHQNDYVFKQADGTPFRPDSLTRSFQRALARAGFSNMRFHDLRHSTASILADRGWDINSIKDWLGHADIKTTANIYTHISRQRKVALSKDLSGLFTIERKESEE